MSRIRKTNIFFMVLLAAYVGGSYLIGALSNYFAISDYLLIGSGQLLLLIPSVFYVALSKDVYVAMIKKQKLGIGNILIVILLAYLFMPLMAMINLLSMQLSENHVNTMMIEMMENPFWVNLFFVAVLPAFVEEFIFRGIFFHSYREAGVLKAAIISGVLFGLVHLNLNQFSYAFVMGVIFALLIEATGSIFAPIIFHFIINGNSITMATLSFASMSLEELAIMEEATQNMLGVSGTAMNSGAMVILVLMGIVVVLLITFLGVLAFIWLAKRSGRMYHIKNMFVRKEKSAEKIIDIPLIIGIVACVVFMIMTEIG